MKVHVQLILKQLFTFPCLMIEQHKKGSKWVFDEAGFSMHSIIAGGTREYSSQRVP